MKKLLLSLFLAVGIGTLSATTESITPILKQNTNQMSVGYACKYSQCDATAKSTGKRCKHCVSNDGDLYCWQHR